MVCQACDQSSGDIAAHKRGKRRGDIGCGDPSSKTDWAAKDWHPIRKGPKPGHGQPQEEGEHDRIAHNHEFLNAPSRHGPNRIQYDMAQLLCTLGMDASVADTREDLTARWGLGIGEGKRAVLWVGIGPFEGCCPNIHGEQARRMGRKGMVLWRGVCWRNHLARLWQVPTRETPARSKFVLPQTPPLFRERFWGLREKTKPAGAAQSRSSAHHLLGKAPYLKEKLKPRLPWSGHSLHKTGGSMDANARCLPRLLQTEPTSSSLAKTP